MVNGSISQELLREELRVLENCRICPRNCGADRFSGKLGYCKSDAGFHISSICNHRGEEPVISGSYGICNVFFSHCNLQCVFCQNHQISFNQIKHERTWQPDQVLEAIIKLLDEGCKNVGFVSPSHHIPQMKFIIKQLQLLGKDAVIVYNTNAYDNPETIRELDSLVDVYLPDFKYSDKNLARKFSDAFNYPEVALKAVKEMYRQKGSTLVTDADGIATSGLIIRHLVIPGHIQNSIDVLRTIADEISVNVHISLMSQYHPTENVSGINSLNRVLHHEEYQMVVEEFYKLGFKKGWIQELVSSDHYNPDFRKDHPFE